MTNISHLECLQKFGSHLSSLARKQIKIFFLWGCEGCKNKYLKPYSSLSCLPWGAGAWVDVGVPKILFFIQGYLCGHNWRIQLSRLEAEYKVRSISFYSTLPHCRAVSSFNWSPSSPQLPPSPTQGAGCPSTDADPGKSLLGQKQEATRECTSDHWEPQ